VLITGGTESREAELFDPSTGEMRSAGQMLHARSEHAAGVIRSRWVLIAGGTDETGAAVEGAEVYDPETSTFHEVEWKTGIGRVTPG